MEDQKANGFVTLPADLQQGLAASAVVQLSQWLHKLTGGTVIIAAQLPGIVADNGKPTVVVMCQGNFATGEQMVDGITQAVRDLAATTVGN